MIKVNIEVTLSKVFVFFAFTVASAYSFIYKDPTPLVTAIPSLTVLFGAKIMHQAKIDTGIFTTNNK